MGFDASPAAYVALDWGAKAAAAHDVPLTLLTARPDADAPVIALDDPQAEALIEDDLAGVLEEAEQRVAAEFPHLEMHTIIHPASPVEGLLSASKTADMLVIGSRGLGGFAELLIGSTAMNVTPYADCPVVVQYVPDEATLAARKAARHPNEVVVGFDGSRFSERALLFGLRHAQAEGLGVAVVYVSPGSPQQDPAPISLDDPELDEEAREDLAMAQRLARGFPDVAVNYLYAVGRPAGILIHEASGSPLAAIGARGRGGFAQLLLGSVGLQMLIHAECPVAVVRDLPVV